MKNSRKMDMQRYYSIMPSRAQEKKRHFLKNLLCSDANVSVRNIYFSLRKICQKLLMDNLQCLFVVFLYNSARKWP